MVDMPIFTEIRFPPSESQTNLISYKFHPAANQLRRSLGSQNSIVVSQNFNQRVKKLVC